jgi:rRNA-processing protein FCF1
VAHARLYLNDGVDPAQAKKGLRELINEAGNLASYGAGPNGVITLRDRYIAWVENVEAQLSWMARDADVLAMLHTPRHFYIRDIGQGTPRPSPLVEAEAKAQSAALKRMVDDLEERTRRLSAAPGHITVLDTNLLLEYQPPGQIPWPQLLRCPAVRLVVPLRVVEELDAKKYAQRRDLADRARRVLRQLDADLGSAGAPGKVQPGVTIEVPVDPGPRRRPADADAEILDTCHEVRQLTGQAVTLVTGDTAMRLRAQARGITVTKMPAEYERMRAATDGEMAAI